MNIDGKKPKKSIHIESPSSNKSKSKPNNKKKAVFKGGGVDISMFIKRFRYAPARSKQDREPIELFKEKFEREEKKKKENFQKSPDRQFTIKTDRKLRGASHVGFVHKPQDENINDELFMDREERRTNFESVDRLRELKKSMGMIGSLEEMGIGDIKEMAEDEDDVFSVLGNEVLEPEESEVQQRMEELFKKNGISDSITTRESESFDFSKYKLPDNFAEKTQLSYDDTVLDEWKEDKTKKKEKEKKDESEEKMEKEKILMMMKEIIERVEKEKSSKRKMDSSVDEMKLSDDFTKKVNDILEEEKKVNSEKKINRMVYDSVHGNMEDVFENRKLPGFFKFLIDPDEKEMNFGYSTENLLEKRKRKERRRDRDYSNNYE